MKVLVTGGTGFIGRAILPALGKRGHEVFALARQIPADSGDGTQWIQSDLSGSLQELPAVDVILHLAQGQVPVPDRAVEMHEINAGSTLRLLDHARRCGARKFLLASTGNVYGFGSRPFTESDPLKPQGFYPVSKANAENLVKCFAGFMDTSVLRFFSPYGPGQTARLIPDIINRVREGRAVQLKEGGRPHLTPVYIDDAVEAVCRLLERTGSEVVNIAGDQHVSLREIAEISGECLGREPVLEHLTDPAPGDLTGENALMRELTGLEDLWPVREGLARMI